LYHQGKMSHWQLNGVCGWSHFQPNCCRLGSSSRLSVGNPPLLNLYQWYHRGLPLFAISQGPLLWCLAVSLYQYYIYYSKKMNVGGAIRVCVLESPHAKMTELGCPLSLVVELQCCGLHLDTLLWTVRLSNGGYLVSLFWPLQRRSLRRLFFKPN
jgi:hypothetical protein